MSVVSEVLGDESDQIQAPINDKTDNSQAGYHNRSWDAHINLGFVHSAFSEHKKTVLKDVQFKGPLRVQRPFYPENEVCHVYLLHPPGGMVSGDTLAINCRVQDNAHCLLTTPSAGKIYGADSNNGEQTQNIDIKVEKKAVCEWLPQETIIFNRANAQLNTTFSLASDASFMGWDMVCLGRKYGDEPFVEGNLKQLLSVKLDERLILHEKFAFHANSDLHNHDYGLAKCNAFGSFVIKTDDPKELVESIRGVLPEPKKHSRYSVSEKLGIVFVRGIDMSIENLRERFVVVWQHTRKQAVGKDKIIPRIWNT